MPVDEYKRWSEEKIKAIEAEMATLSSKKDPRYVKLYNMKDAQKKRLRRKIKTASQKTEKIGAMANSDVMAYLIS